MGNCSKICSRIIITSSDVPLNAINYKQNININIDKYSKEPYLNKIIYIQSWVKYFLRKKKKMHKLQKNNKNTKHRFSTNIDNSYYSKSKTMKKKKTILDDNDSYFYQKKKTYLKTDIKNKKTIK